MGADQTPQHQVVITPKGGLNIACAAISQDAKYVAVSDTVSTRLFTIQTEEEVCSFPTTIK